MAIGSSAEQGSSIKSTAGSVAMARAMHSRCCWPPERARPLLCSLSLTSSQRAAPRRACSTFSALFALEAVELQPERHVAVDAHGKRVGLLEDHADVAADGHRVDAGMVDVLAVEVDVPLEAEAADQVVHAVQAAEHGALAAARRADEGRDAVLLDRNAGVADGLEGAVVQLPEIDVDDHVGRLRRVAAEGLLWFRGYHARFLC